MSDFYVNPQASGSTEVGTSANPFLDLQDAVDAVQTATGAPHTIYCQGTQTVTTAIDFSTVQDGSLSSGFIKMIGTNSSWVDDDTVFCLDGADAVNYCINPGTAQYWHVKNLEVKNAINEGIYAAFYYSIFENVISHDNGAEGLRNNYFCVHLKCSFYNNGAEGIDGSGPCLFCHSYSNASHGFYSNDALFFGCIAHDNGGHGFFSSENYVGGPINCVAYNNTDNNISVYSPRVALAIGNRSVDSGAYGIAGGSGTTWLFEAYNFLLGNTSGTKTGQIFEGGGTETTGTEGFTDAANDDYTLTSSATLRRTAIELP